MANNTITGTVHEIGDVQDFGPTFSKCQVVIKTDSQYDPFIPIEFVNDKINLVQNLSEGETVTVHYDLRGRYWEKGNRYFLTAQAWKVDGPENDREGVQNRAQAVTEPETVEDAESGVQDDIPF